MSWDLRLEFLFRKRFLFKNVAKLLVVTVISVFIVVRFLFCSFRCLSVVRFVPKYVLPYEQPTEYQQGISNLTIAFLLSKSACRGRLHACFLPADVDYS